MIQGGSTVRQFHYNANGNMDCRGATTSTCTNGNPIEWYVSQLPKKITNGTASTFFTYGPDRQRVSQQVADTQSATHPRTRTVNYIGPHFEMETRPGGVSRYRINVFANDRVVYSRVEPVGGASTAPEAYYPLRDQQGSVVKVVPAISPPMPNPYIPNYSFDAFGQRRSPYGLPDSTPYGQAQWTERGYTGHEHLDDVEMVHMNGRVEHPGIGRFLSPDPVLGDLSHPQSLNRYSYVSNSPLKYSDPSGFSSCKIEDSDGKQYLSCPTEVSVYSDMPVHSGPIGYLANLSFQIDNANSMALGLGNLLASNGGAVVHEFTVVVQRGPAVSMADRLSRLGQTFAGDIIPSFANNLFEASPVGMIFSADLAGQALIQADNPESTAAFLAGLAATVATGGRGQFGAAAKAVLPTPGVASRKLQSIVNNLYKGTTNPNRIGNGTTADAIRHELSTGQAVGGKFHLQKGQESIRALENWIRGNPNGSYGDRVVAESLLDDLRRAVGGL